MKRENKQAFKKGVRNGIPIALGYFAVAFTLGIAAANSGLNAFQATLASLTNNASEDTILEIINNTDSAQCAQKLIDVANSNGGSDNITAVVVYK